MSPGAQVSRGQTRASEQQGPAPVIRGRLAREGQRLPGPEQGSGDVHSFLGHCAAQAPLPARAPGAEALARPAGAGGVPHTLGNCLRDSREMTLRMRHCMNEGMCGRK